MRDERLPDPGPPAAAWLPPRPAFEDEFLHELNDIGLALRVQALRELNLQ